MIGKISGRLDYRASDHVLIDTGGVGYLVYCSDRTLASMPSPGGMVALYTELVVREDLLQLFGFPTLAEREWHRLLTSVQGVGAKVGLAIVGALGTEGVARALALGDAPALRKVSGVGPKLAVRIVTELKEKAPTLMALGADGAQAATVSGGSPETLPAQPEAASQTPVAATPAPRTEGSDGAQAQADALSALVNLGYPQGDAAAAIAEAGAGGRAESTEDLIFAALRLLAPKS